MASHGMRALIQAAIAPKSSPRMALSKSRCYSAGPLYSRRQSVGLLFAPRSLGVGAWLGLCLPISSRSH